MDQTISCYFRRREHVIGRYILCRVRGIDPYPRPMPAYDETTPTIELTEMIETEDSVERSVVEKIGN